MKKVFRCGAIMQDCDTILYNMNMLVMDGIITDIVPNNGQIYDCNHDLSDKIIIPGFRNMHTHAAMIGLKGIADDLPLDKWLNDHIFPKESELLSSDWVYTNTLRALREMVRNGITYIDDMYYFTNSVYNAFDKAGIRGNIGITIFNSSDLPLFNLPDNKLITFNLAPHAPYSVSDDTFKNIVAVANDMDLSIQCHVSETAEEVKNSYNMHGMSSVSRLSNLGVFDRGDTTIIHAVHLDDYDRDILSYNNVSIVSCPVSNAKLSSGLMDYDSLKEHDINIMLGTDGSASNNSLDIRQDAKFMTLMQKHVYGADYLPAKEIFNMLTCNNDLCVGSNADFITINRNSIDSDNILSHIVYGMNSHDIQDNFVAGKGLMQDRQLSF